jgi:MFS family permease
MEQGWRKHIIWGLVTLFVVYSFCLSTAAAVFSPSIKSALKVSDLAVSLATGAFVLGYACLQIPVGYLLDKFNAKYIVSAGIFLLVLGNVAISFSTSLWTFTLSNLLQGFGAAFAFVSAAVLVTQWYPSRMFPILFGLTEAMSCVFAGIIHYYLNLALKVYAWNDIYQWLALFGFILLVLSFLFVTSPAQKKPKTSLSLNKSLHQVLGNPQILLCTLAAATSFGVLLAYASLWYLPVQTYYSVQSQQAVIISGMLLIGLGIGTPVLGWISNKVKSRTMVLHVSLVLGTMGLLLCLYLPHYNIDTYIIIKTISFITGFFLSGSMLLYTIVSEISTDSTRGVAISVLNTAVFLFNSLLLFIPYLFITELSKQFFTYLWVLPFFILIAILLIYFIKNSYSDNQ